MPQDAPGAVSPLAPFEGSRTIPELGLTRRWFDARSLTPDIRGQVLDVLRVAFNGQPTWFALPVTPEDHFDWKFRDRPTGVTVTLSLDEDGRVVGFVASVRRIWYLQGRPYVARAGYDLCRLPEWQGRGVQRALQQFREREWHPSEDFGFGYSTHPADRHVALGRGNKAPANETHDFVRLLRPLRSVRDLVNRARRTGEAPAPGTVSNTAAVIQQRERTVADRTGQFLRRSARAAASVLSRRPAPPPGAWTIATIPRFEEQHALFIARALSQFEFVADRSVSYLNWRFCDQRAGPFTVRLAQQGDVHLGYAVTRVLDGNAYLADIIALPGHLAVAESLIRDAVRLAHEAGADSIRARLPKRHPYRGALGRAGFFDLGHVAGELMDPRRTSEAELAFLDSEHTRVHHVLADSDYL